MMLKSFVNKFSKVYKKAEIQSFQMEEPATSQAPKRFSISDYYAKGDEILTRVEIMVDNANKLVMDDLKNTNFAWRLLDKSGADGSDLQRVITLTIANRSAQRRDYFSIAEELEPFEHLRNEFYHAYGVKKVSDDFGNETIVEFPKNGFFELRYQILKERVEKLRNSMLGPEGVEADIKRRAAQINALRYQMHTITRGLDLEMQDAQRMRCENFMNSGRIKIDILYLPTNYLKTTSGKSEEEKVLQMQ